MSAAASTEEVPIAAIPRIAPLAPGEWTEEQQQVFGPIARSKGAYNILGTFARHWTAFQAMRPWNNYLIGPNSTASHKSRELVILRTAWLTQAEYEWAQHKPRAIDAGLTAADVERIKEGGTGWPDLESALLDMTDDLVLRHMISDPVWGRLERHLSVQQILDCLFTVGQYITVALFAKTAGVQVDPGFSGFDPSASF